MTDTRHPAITDPDFPKHCPKCGHTTINGAFPDWKAQSLEDSSNACVLTEYQCANDDCCISFWL